MDERELEYESEQYLQRLERKEKSSRMTNKMPCRIEIAPDKAKELLEIESTEDSNPAYRRRNQDLKNKNMDYLREATREQKFRAKENLYERVLKLRKQAEKKEKKGENLSNEEKRVLRKDKIELKKKMEKARSSRLQAGNFKEQAWTQKTKIDTELKRYRSAGDKNILEQDETLRWTKTYNNAPRSVKQSLKRSEAEVGRLIALQLCKSDNLKKLDYHQFMPLLKEYRECYSTADEMWAVLTKVTEQIEENKLSLSRLGLAETCYTILTRENQLAHAKAVEVLLSGDQTKYEMKLQILSTLRSKQVSRDGKSETQVNMRSEIKNKELVNKYNKVVRKRDRSRNGGREFRNKRKFERKFERNFKKDNREYKPFKRNNKNFKNNKKSFKREYGFKENKRNFKPNYKGRDRKERKNNQKAIKQEPQ